MTTQSSPTIIRETTFEFEQQMILSNKEQFDVLLATFTPELYCIQSAISLNYINPSIIPAIVQALGRVASCSGNGDVVINIEKDVKTGIPMVKRIRSIDKYDPDIPLVIKK